MTVDGFRIVYERICPFELNLLDPDCELRIGEPITSKESLRVKVLIKVRPSF